MQKSYRYLGFERIFNGIIFGFFFLFGVFDANADFTPDIQYTQKANSSGYGVAWYQDSARNSNRMEYVAGLTGYLREVKYSCLYYPNDRLYHFEIRSSSNSLLYRSADYHTNLCGHFSQGHTDDWIKTVAIAQFDNLYFEAGEHFYFGFVVDDIGYGCNNGNIDQPSCLIVGMNTSALYTYDYCTGGNITCTSISSSYGIWLNTKIDTTQLAPLKIPQLYSPSLPYVSSSTPIRFTVLNPDSGRVVCVNSDNSWRQSSGIGVANSYFSFAADVESGVNGIRCHSEQGTRISGYLDFELTFTPGTLAAPTPLFIETTNGYVYSYNPARVEVQGAIAGDIWCKRGSGSFFNAGSVIEGGSVLFDLDFTDLGTLASGMEYTVACYLETQEGNSATVQQVYKYQAGSICSPDFGTALEDKGIILSTLGNAYTVLTNLPIIGDLIYLDCVIIEDFYSNLVLVETSNLTYHINAFNVDQDVTIPLVTLKSTMDSWLTGTGYSSIKSTITILLWILLMFGLFFKFLFPMVNHGNDKKNNLDWDEDEYGDATEAGLKSHFDREKD